jgi:hypothetical protein
MGGGVATGVVMVLTAKEFLFWIKPESLRTFFYSTKKRSERAQTRAYTLTQERYN